VKILSMMQYEKGKVSLLYKLSVSFLFLTRTMTLAKMQDFVQGRQSMLQHKLNTGGRTCIAT
jgi:hypothetical protein